MHDAVFVSSIGRNVLRSLREKRRNILVMVIRLESIRSECTTLGFDCSICLTDFAGPVDGIIALDQCVASFDPRHFGNRVNV